MASESTVSRDDPIPHECNPKTVLSMAGKNRTRGKALFSNLWFHDLANRLKVRRKVEAKNAGLGDDWDPGTYPSHPVHITSGIVKGALLALAATGTGAGGVLYLMDKLKPAPAIPSPVTPPPTTDKVNVIDIGSG